MTLREWSNSNVDYARKIVNSGLEGARSGQDEFLHGQPLAPLLNKTARNALRPAAVGACLGVLSSVPASRRKSPRRACAYGLLGGAIGLIAGLIWENRQLTATVASTAWRNIGKVRDEHWLEVHPIDYA